ncbi:MAG TPA: hypothetical protein VLL98_02535 [Rickettsiales bacterium]|nr:hypothetical protein [Rickettsiales bacterium]
MGKKKVGVFFGGKSFEHDVSILTGLDVCSTIDSTQYDVFPVYIDLENNWWTGEELLNKGSYPLNDYVKQELNKTKIVIGNGKSYLETEKKGFFCKTKKINFDIAFLAFHGDYGETGFIQGLFETASIPYTGCNPEASAIFMDKSMTKRIAKTVGVPVLSEELIKKPENQNFFDIEKIIKDVKLPLPLIVKPNSLGSSVGVKKASNKDELSAAILQVFALGDDALLEPFVDNLEEYNLSVSRAFGETKTSAIERPFKKNSNILSFNEKYKIGGSKSGTKVGGAKFANTANQGSMLSMSRECNPKELTAKEEENIRTWAKLLFDVVGGNGDPRIDFLCNSKTREIYLCEVNPLPGSFAFYLWEAAEHSKSYTELLTALLEEAENKSKLKRQSVILTESKIF